MVESYPWEYAKNMWIWHLRAQFNVEQADGAGITVELDDFKGLLQS